MIHIETRDGILLKRKLKMKPTDKSPELDDFIKKTFGFDRKASIVKEECVFCKKEAKVFRDELSRKEFSISGLCQDCQDETFGK